MARKGKAPKTTKAADAAAAPEPISALGWKAVAAGAFCVLVGFLVLAKADRLGRNWASDAAPLLILAGYAAVGLGLFAPAPSAEGEKPSSAAPPAQP